jgi:hypothetical protein
MSSVALKSFPQLVSDIKAFYGQSKPIDEDRAAKFMPHLSSLTEELNRSNTGHVIQILNCMCEFDGIALKDVVVFKDENINHALSYSVKMAQPSMIQYDSIEATKDSVQNNSVVVFYDEAMLVKDSTKTDFEPANVVNKVIYGEGKYRYGFEGDYHYVIGFIPE